MGHRSSDRRPPIADVVVIGHGVLGATAAPVQETDGPGLARIAAELVTAGRTDTDISAYRVDRFAHTGADAIQAAADSQYLMRHPPAAGAAATPFGIELP